MKKALIRTLIIVSAFISLECFLQLYFGFCDTVLIKADPNYEYIAKPNQNRFRFRNYIKYNSKSMRSDEIEDNSIKILGFGDSVFNGGVETDHDSLASTLLSTSLTQSLGTEVQFLNVSAGSWGPDNCFAYLEQNGTFDSKAIFLFVSSHDAYDNMNFEKIVGINPSFPEKQHWFGVLELIERYIIPKFKWLNEEQDDPKGLGINKQKKESSFNSGFQSFYTFCREEKIPFVIYLHATKAELQDGAYNRQGQEIIQFCVERSIPIIQDLYQGIELSQLRDQIHINTKGQKKMTKIVLDYINENFDKTMTYLY